MILSGNEHTSLLGAVIGMGVGAGLALLGSRIIWGRGRVMAFAAPTPQPGWQVGQNQPLPFASDRMISMAVSDMAASQCYPLVISTVVPRPIAFVCSLSSTGERNLAPYSYFGAMCHDPPHVTIGICRSRAKPGGKKDTLTNILATKEFTLNMMSEWFIESANHTCGEFDADVDEMELSGLTSVPSKLVKPPRVKESAVHMECKLVHTYEVKNTEGIVTATIVVGEVVMFHVAEAVAGKTPSGNVVVETEPYQPISRLGGNTYARVAGTFDLPRPDRKVA